MLHYGIKYWLKLLKGPTKKMYLQTNTFNHLSIFVVFSDFQQTPLFSFLGYSQIFLANC